MPRISACKVAPGLQVDVPRRSCGKSILVLPYTALCTASRRRRLKKELIAKEECGQRWSQAHGIETWDGFAWTQEGQGRLRVQRRWDTLQGTWLVVPNTTIERSCCPLDTRGEDIDEESEDERDDSRSWEGRGIDEAGSETRDAVAHHTDSFFLAPTRIGSSNDAICATILEKGDVAKGKVGLLQRVTLGITSFYAASKRELQGLRIDRLRTKRSQEEVEAEEGGGDSEEGRMSRSRTVTTPSNGMECDGSGLGRLLDSINMERVERVRYIWNAGDTGMDSCQGRERGESKCSG